jgi:hypothetical protein
MCDARFELSEQSAKITVNDPPKFVGPESKQHYVGYPGTQVLLTVTLVMLKVMAMALVSRAC